ncbi:hypothetical protein VTO42DRAFT_7289 [Malbranchea cinnamomea]
MVKLEFDTPAAAGSRSRPQRVLDEVLSRVQTLNSCRGRMESLGIIGYAIFPPLPHRKRQDAHEVHEAFQSKQDYFGLWGWVLCSPPPLKGSIFPPKSPDMQGDPVGFPSLPLAGFYPRFSDHSGNA